MTLFSEPDWIKTAILSQKEIYKVKCFFASEEMFLCIWGNVSLHLRKCFLCLMEMFHLLKFLNWCGANYCNYSKYLSTNFSFWIGIFFSQLKYFLYFSVPSWKYFLSGVEIFCLWCRTLPLVWTFFFFIVGNEKFPQRRQNIFYWTTVMLFVFILIILKSLWIIFWQHNC